MRDMTYCLTTYRAGRFRFCWAFDNLPETRRMGMKYVRQGAGGRVEITIKNRVIWARGVTKK
jgi:hypothetical protein